NRLVATDVTTADADTLLALLEKSVEIKRQIVAADPTEKGIRRALNLGHTAGHAIESLMLKRGTPIAHGHAVAAGMLVTMLLSRDRLDFPRDLIYRYVGFFKATFGASMIECKDYDELLALMGHDKKNVVAGEVSFTLLRRPGEPVIDVVVPRAEIVAALDMFQDLIG
ncbi:MAG: 3-dehydroquinate synthase, partial [Muribaculaceae bacterium]|nr:3-dehydroquinate synthase [Muribaculaceae bacterium]